MEHADLNILGRALGWMESGLTVTLLTIIKVHGPSPRPLGSIMVINENGAFIGSVSGGCIEQDLLEYIANALPDNQPRIRRYGGDPEQQRRFQLPCGGAVEICLEWLDNLSLLRTLTDTLDAGKPLARHTDLRNGKITLCPASADTPTLRRDQNSFTRLYGPQWHIFIVGAGDLSQHVAQLALRLDYRVTVCDPREEYAHGWQIPGTTFLRTMPDDALLDITPDTRCAILTLTHDPRLDDMALLEALISPAFFVGALGSRRSAAQRLERLHYMGLSETQTDRLHAPVGLPIGSHSAAEIAISIMAQLVQIRNQSPVPTNSSQTCPIL